MSAGDVPDIHQMSPGGTIDVRMFVTLVHKDHVMAVMAVATAPATTVPVLAANILRYWPPLRPIGVGDAVTYGGSLRRWNVIAINDGRAWIEPEGGDPKCGVIFAISVLHHA